MRSPGQAWFLSLVLTVVAQAPLQNTSTGTKVPRFQMKQEQLCCSAVQVVNPVYPQKARLAHTEGEVRLVVIIAANGTVTELQNVSGDPLLVEPVTSAVQQWRFNPTLVNGTPVETEVPITFTFTIQDPPKPTYLHLTNGKVIRADSVREFTDGVEYTADRRTHRLLPSAVAAINACGGTPAVMAKDKNCIPGGGISFHIVATPLLPANKSDHNAASH